MRGDRMFFMMANAGLLDTYQVQIIPFVSSPFFTYLFYTFFLSFPKELEEAARVDGAGPLTTFWRVVFRNARPVYAAVAILSFLFRVGGAPVACSSHAGTGGAPAAARNRGVSNPSAGSMGGHHGLHRRHDNPIACRIPWFPGRLRPQCRPHWDQRLIQVVWRRASCVAQPARVRRINPQATPVQGRRHQGIRLSDLCEGSGPTDTCYSSWPGTPPESVVDNRRKFHNPAQSGPT